MTETPTFIHPGDLTLVAAVSNLVLGRKQSQRRGSQVFLDGMDIQKVMRIVEIINEAPPPLEAERYGKPVTDTIPTDSIGDLENQLGDTARRGLRARLDGQQPVPKE